MAHRELTIQELAERERLAKWMQENGHNNATVAAATGDFYTTIQMMTEGNRRISQGFKWRFSNAFGDGEARKVFPRKVEQLAMRRQLQPVTTP